MGNVRSSVGAADLVGGEPPPRLYFGKRRSGTARPHCDRASPRRRQKSKVKSQKAKPESRPHCERASPRDFGFCISDFGFRDGAAFPHGEKSAKTRENADVCAILRRLFHRARNGTNIEVLARRIWLRDSKMQVFVKFRSLRRRGAKYWTSDLVNRKVFRVGRPRIHESERTQSLSLPLPVLTELTARSRRRF